MHQLSSVTLRNCLRTRFSLAALTLLVGLSAPVARAEAQAYNYPSLQLPSASTRDYTAALSGGAGTTALFQWREGWSPRSHLQLDLGLVDRRNSETLMLFVGGFMGRELARAGGDQPLDLLFTAGAGAAFSSGVTLLRVPVGISIGHTFELDQGVTLTPYVHPRVSIDVCSSCGRRDQSRSEVSLNFDLGLNLQVNRRFAVRAAGSFSGSDLLGTEDTFAVGFNWTPAALKR